MAEIQEEAWKAMRAVMQKSHSPIGERYVSLWREGLEAAAPILAAHYRREALEKAAGVADIQADLARDAEAVTHDDFFAGAKEAAEVIGSRIRALKEKPNG